MKKFIALIRNIANKTANVGPYSEKAQDAYMAARVKRLMKKSYEAGASNKEACYEYVYDDDAGFDIIQETSEALSFNEWFKKKYE